MSFEPGYKYTDKEMLDFLQEELDKSEYTGKCIFRKLPSGRGWKLQESSWEGSASDVRQAIREGMDKSKDPK